MYEAEKCVYTFKRTEEPDRFVLHFINMNGSGKQEIFIMVCLLENTYQKMLYEECYEECICILFCILRL